MFSFDRSKKNFISSWWWTIDHILLSAILLLMGIGLLMVATSSPIIADRIGLENSYFIEKQIIFLSLGLIILFITSVLDVEHIKILAKIGFIGGIIALIAVLILGNDLNGAKRWISIFGISTQPSEFVKPFFVLFTAYFLSFELSEGYYRYNFLNSKLAKFFGFDFLYQYRFAIIGYLTFILLLMIQPDFGMSVVITAIFGALLFIANIPVSLIFICIILAFLAFLYVYNFLPHVTRRIDSFLNGSEDEAGFQVQKSLEAFYNGGFTGKGPGEGIVKQNLPDSHTDFVFAVVGEELGILVCLFIVLIYGVIIWRSFKIAFKETDKFTCYAVIGLSLILVVQAMVNMGVSLHLLPTKGMTLPFISYGGSSLIAVCITAGLLLGLTKKRYGFKLQQKPVGQFY